ncbi:MAG: YceI family protein [Acidobacteriota bacterium]|nr:YceI family protein [Acidobacteriota bacterium]
MKLRIIFLCAILVLTTGILCVAGEFIVPVKTETLANSPIVVHYKIDSSQSKFMVHASRGGLAYFKGHSHEIAARDFSGDAELTLDLINPASLQMTIRADSLEETSDVFTPQQKQIIKKELQEIVLQTAKYPEITFKSTDVKGNLVNGQFDVKIGGDMTLHGVTKHIVIPARVSASGDTLRAQGEFSINRKDFKVNATNAFHGFVRIKHELKFTFDIVGHRV